MAGGGDPVPSVDSTDAEVVPEGHVAWLAGKSVLATAGAATGRLEAIFLARRTFAKSSWIRFLANQL